MKGRKKTKSAAPHCVVLPPRSTVAQALDIHASLRGWIDSGRPLIVDASHVDEIDTAVLQLLIAAIRAVRARGLPFSWQGLSEAVRRAATLIGVSAALELTASQPPVGSAA
jgi:phospholipid transport system transporter-binding protein